MTANLLVHTPQGFLFVADSRLLSAQYILSDNVQKIFPLSDYTACLSSGYAGNGSELPEFFQKHSASFQSLSPKQCAITIWERGFEIFAAFPDNAFTSLVIAGYDNQRPQVLRILLQPNSISLEIRRSPALGWFAFGDETFTGIVRESRLLDGIADLDTALEYAKHLVRLSQEILTKRLPVSPIGGAIRAAIIAPDHPFRSIP